MSAIILRRAQFAVIASRPCPRFYATDTATLVKRVIQGDRKSLSESITLVESTLDRHQFEAQQLLERLLAATKTQKVQYQDNTDKVIDGTFRIGLSGSPGVGKSSFIETFGMQLIRKGYKVAVLAIDPSSNRTGGSILGDKTRMSQLSLEDKAFIRPSPSSGTMGGVGSHTSDSIMLCEAAGFNIVLVETVGVGQSETLVSSMVDVVLLLVAPGAGDELQGLKKGIVEIADLIVVNKADGDLLPAARAAQIEYTSALKFQKSNNKFWNPKVLSCSSHHNKGFDQVWKQLLEFYKSANAREGLRDPSWFIKNRERQRVSQLWNLVESKLMAALKRYRKQGDVQELEKKVENLDLSTARAASIFLKKFSGSS